MTKAPIDADAKLDEALDETFPASDPPAATVETGVRLGGPEARAGGAVIDNAATSRFELAVSGDTAFLQYTRTPDGLTLLHTEVPAALRGHGAGGALVRAALQSGRAAGLRVTVVCPFASSYLERHADLLSPT